MLTPRFDTNWLLLEPTQPDFAPGLSIGIDSAIKWHSNAAKYSHLKSATDSHLKADRQWHVIQP